MSAFIFDYRRGIMQSDLEPITRLVCLVLSDHMDARGGSCFPSIETLARETGLANSTVRAHIRKAEAAEYLKVGDRAKSGQGWRRYQYWARLPILEAEGAPGDGGRLAEGAPSDEKTCAVSRKNVRRETALRSSVRSSNKGGGANKQEQEPPPPPFEDILKAYHEHCPTLPRVERLTEKRKAAIKELWQSLLPDLETWERYFNAAGSSSFLAGKAQPGARFENPFTADFDWLMKEDKAVLVMEGKYDDREQPRPPSQRLLDDGLTPTQRAVRDRMLKESAQYDMPHWMRGGT